MLQGCKLNASIRISVPGCENIFASPYGTSFWLKVGIVLNFDFDTDWSDRKNVTPRSQMLSALRINDHEITPLENNDTLYILLPSFTDKIARKLTECISTNRSRRQSCLFFGISQSH